MELCPEQFGLSMGGLIYVFRVGIFVEKKGFFMVLMMA